MRVWIMMLLLMLSLTGCQENSTQEVTTEKTADKVTETLVESTTEEATEPRWTKFIEFMVDDYLHHMPEDAYIVPAEVLFNQITSDSPLTVLDLREADAYQAGHLKGAVNVPWGLGFFDALTYIDQSKPVYIYCSTGQLSNQGQVILRLLGYESYVVSLGWDFGISTSEQSVALISTEVLALGNTENQLDEDVLSEVKSYLEDIETKKEAGLGSYSIKPATLIDWTETGKEMTLISVQNRAAYEKGKINGAVNLTFDSHFAHDLLELELKPVVVVYDESGQISNQAVTVLRFLGYEAYSLDGVLE